MAADDIEKPWITPSSRIADTIRGYFRQADIYPMTDEQIRALSEYLTDTGGIEELVEILADLADAAAERFAPDDPYREIIMQAHAVLDEW